MRGMSWLSSPTHWEVFALCLCNAWIVSLDLCRIGTNSVGLQSWSRCDGFPTPLLFIISIYQDSPHQSWISHHVGQHSLWHTKSNTIYQLCLAVCPIFDFSSLTWASNEGGGGLSSYKYNWRAVFGLVGHTLCRLRSKSFPVMNSIAVGEKFTMGMLSIVSDLASTPALTFG